MNQDQLQIKSRRFPKFFWAILIVFLIVFGVLFAKAYNLSNKVFVGHSTFLQKVGGLLFSGTGQLDGENQDRINILLLGYGGEGHDGTYLTDTIILASIRPSTNEILLSSIPRDYLWEEGKSKINFAYADGFSKHNNPSEGAAEAISAVEKLTGEKIPYFATVDFAGFEKAVDRVGGLDVEVEKTFTDTQYPDDKYGYLPPITFEQGPQHMNGTKALEFARSRHGNNDEDSDFARSKRQALIISAFKQKILNLNLFKNAGAVNDLVNILANHAHTNIDPDQLAHLASIAKNKDAKVISQSLDLNTNLVCADPTNEVGYVIERCPGISAEDIRNFFGSGFDSAEIGAEKTEIILENAGTDTNLYIDLKKDLTALGVTVYEVPYRGLPLHSSVLYQINDKAATIRYLESKLGVKAQPKPAQMTALADLVLIVGGGN